MPYLRRFALRSPVRAKDGEVLFKRMRFGGVASAPLLIHPPSAYMSTSFGSSLRRMTFLPGILLGAIVPIPREARNLGSRYLQLPPAILTCMARVLPLVATPSAERT